MITDVETHGPAVIWVMGLSGAGKTTLCNSLNGILKPHMPELLVFDGDGVRQAISQGLGYSEEERIKQFRRMHALVKMVTSQGMVAIVGGLYSNPELSAWNRLELPGYFEVYLKTSLETVRARDTKGLYAKADSGAMNDVVGIDIPWQEPASPDLVFDMDDPLETENMAHVLISKVPRLAAALDDKLASPDTRSAQTR